MHRWMCARGMSEVRVSMADTKYNGYTNYETWAVCLWIDNDEYMQGVARSMVRHKDLEDGSAAQAIKEWFEEMKPELGASLWSDLLNAAMSEVNWQEVAEQYKPEEEEEEEDEV